MQLSLLIVGPFGQDKVSRILVQEWGDAADLLAVL